MGDKRYIIGLPEKLGKKSSKDFILDDLFFEFIGDVLIKSCLLNVTVSCERKQTYWHLEIKVDGFILTICDRCGDDLNIKIKGNDTFFLKAQERNIKLQDDSIIFISSKVTDFNLKKLLQDTCFFLIPITRKHDIKNCNSDAILNLEKFKTTKTGQLISSKILKEYKKKLKKK